MYQKGAGYHLDLFWVAVLLVVCSFMGLPWYVAATVISIAHIDSLKMETETSAPGEQPKFLGVRYSLYVVCLYHELVFVHLHPHKKTQQQILMWMAENTKNLSEDIGALSRDEI